MSHQLQQAVKILQQGGIIAYPTEGVYGLGCDPFNETAVMQLCQIKQRSVEKSFILIAANWQQVKPLITPIPPTRLEIVKASWPGPVTWIFPASKKVPSWICGDQQTVAIRMTDHPIAFQLCQAFDGVIVSTSANIEGKSPLQDIQKVKAEFADKIDFILEGALGNLKCATEIRDALSGKIIRSKS